MITPKNIISSLTAVLNKDSRVVGLVLVGSQSRKKIYIATLYSDMEAYIVVRHHKIADFKKELPKIVSRLGDVVFSYDNRWAGFSTIFNNLFRLELPLIKISDLSPLYSRPKSQPVKILIDKTGGMLKEVTKRQPKSIDYQKEFQETFSDFWYMMTVSVQYFKKGEIYNAREALSINTSSLIKFLELLNDPTTLLLERNKMIEKFLTEEQITLLKEVSPAYNFQEIKQSLKKIMDIFSNVANKIKEKYKYSYNIDMENRIKPKLLQLLG